MRLWRSLAAVGIMEERSTGRGYNNKPVLSVQLSWLLFTKTERWQFAPAEIGRVVPAAQVEQV
jgi:hypothetical protein